MSQFIIISESVLKACISEITLDPDNPQVVTIKPHKESRSSAQRRLMWMWYTEIGKQQGETKETIRNRLMYRYGVGIFYLFDIHTNGVSSVETIDSIKKLKILGLNHEYQQMMKSFVAVVSSNSFDVKQNKMYLDFIQQYAIENGLGLTFPDDLKYALE